MLDYINSFFKQFSISEDSKDQHFYTLYLKESILEFQKEETKEKAMEVYEMFFDCYKLKTNQELNFVDLLDVLKSYEENASTLIDKQRDHFVHSVNVFLLGLSIYSSNPNFQRTYKDYKKTDVTYQETTLKEMFFYEWGLASLCHDIGYPIEITSKQINKFSDIITRADITGMESRPYIDFHNFDAINGFINKSDEDRLDKPLDILSSFIGEFLNLDYTLLNKALYNFPELMKKGGFVDHGYYSAIILLKWYAYLSEDENNKEVLMKSIISASSAILLHNYYKNGLMREPFNLGLLKASSHPLSYLLILCDELQDWNREAYGIEDKKKAAAGESRINIGKDSLDMTYLILDGQIEEEYREKKLNSIIKVIDLYEIFPEGLNIDTMSLTDLYIEDIAINEKGIQPRLLIQNIEKLAKMIHDDYNKKQLLRNPDEDLAYPTWESLPQTLKYSNIRQAKQMTEKLVRLGYSVLPSSATGDEVKSLTDIEVEFLSKLEHDSWLEERVQNGWKYGPVKNVEKKESPFIIPYDDLSEEIKELDRDAVRNIIPLLNTINLSVYK
ncbi:MAG: RyR domain-containing protein [Tissierellaceae bacterium]|nr:RyR domain-containing protein [Tissierellaceae bacterium]